jgi:predicted metal-dependent hydrolase
MACSYDALRDCLAELAVAAVQHPRVAVQTYWLALAYEALCLEQGTDLTCGTLVQRGLAALPRDSWARDEAPRALLHVLQAGTLLVADVPRVRPLRGVVSWEALRPYEDVVVQAPEAYWPYADEIRDDIAQLWRAVAWLYRTLTSTRPTIPAEVLRGVVLFEAGLYFACHDYFETLWGRTEDLASDFYQGLIQVAVALQHVHSHNVRGALILCHNGTRRLQRYPDVYKGLDLAGFLQQLATLQQDLAASPEATESLLAVVKMPRLLPDVAL